MITSIYASKLGMTQAWDTTGKRLAVTKCRINPNMILGSRAVAETDQNMLKIGFGTKKLKNMKKPLRTIIEKSGFSNGVTGMTEIAVGSDTELKAGDTIAVETVLNIGDVVKVQGTTKGRGFAGGMKRHGFHGGPKTHGQSDRARAIGSIGAGTTPGKVLKGKKMPGHYGVDTQTVRGLVVVHIDQDNQEVWLSGPVPGSINGVVKITNLGKTKNVKLDRKASGLPEVVVETPAEVSSETQE